MSTLVTQRTGVIVGALNFSDTLHDSKTIEAALEQYERLTENKAKDVFLDRGYRGMKKVRDTFLHYPKPDKSITTARRQRHKRRAAIEPVIGHLKHDYRMICKYLKGTIGDEMNVLLSAAAMNFKRVMNLSKQKCVQFILHSISQFQKSLYYRFSKLTF